ncbi:MAG: glutaredoxin family protein [Thiobacillus sp.]|uniref:glutaredoxin family protein n=1 Tax=Thiobacillus sp. TaxID=924 RepID=UPI002733C83B|nr:glutaredoxin family protein [Thiobacillus sp.]MDP3584685.1 glutaredoxin family protein [Thiobacillus sp.]
MSRTLTFYTRAGCPLCEDMADAVRPLAEAGGHRLQAVDVDADPALKARYGWDVPLLFDADVEICRHELNLPALRDWLHRNSGPS